jgi:hypothetical protein
VIKEINDEKIIKEIADLAVEGVIRAEDVVAAARPEKSPLHRFFTWDDTEAAERYRIYEARNLLRCVVRYLPINGDKKPTRVFVSLTPDRNEEGGGYRIMADILTAKDMKAQMLEDALEEMRRFEEKYRALKELVEIFKAFKIVREMLKIKLG